MSFNQSKGDKSESQHYRKTGRSTSGNQRSFPTSGGGKSGGGNAPTPQQSSNSVTNNSTPSLSNNRSFKKNSNNGQVAQSRLNVNNLNQQVHNNNNNAPVARPGQNGAPIQPPLSAVVDAPVSGVIAKPANQSSIRNNRPVPKPPTSQPTDAVAHSTPAKADAPKSFQLQFGSISPGVVNGMQIPARTNSAPPNLDEQKRDQVRHDSFRAPATIPIPSAPKQHQSVKESGNSKQSTPGELHASSSPSKRDLYHQVTSATGTTITQKASVLPTPGMPMPIPFSPQIPVPFGAPNAHIQSQNISTTSLQMPLPTHLPVGNAGGQQMFVPGLQPHPIQTQGMIPQGQNLNFAAQIAHQMTPQMSNIGIGISPQYSQQQAGKFGVLRKAVKITHPDTHEELRLDGGSTGSRPHPNAPPQSQPMPSFAHHQINYYPPMQPGSYNATSMYFPTAPNAVPLNNPQLTTVSQATRYNYSVGQGPHDHIVTGSVPLHTVQVRVKPAVVPPSEKVVTSSVTISSPAVVSKGDSPKSSKVAPKEAIISHSHSTTNPAQRIPATAPSSASISLLEESASTNTEGRQKEPVRRTESFKDRQKKEDASDSAGTANSSSLKKSRDVAQAESIQSPSTEPSPSTVGHPGLEHSNTSKDAAGAPSPDIPVDAAESVADGKGHGHVNGLQPEDTRSDKLVAPVDSKEDQVEVQVKQGAAIVNVDHELVESTKQGSKDSEIPKETTCSRSSEETNQIEDTSVPKQITIGSDSVEHQESERSVDCSDAQTTASTSVLPASSCDEKTSNVDTSSERDDSVICSSTSDQDIHPDSNTIASNDIFDHKAKDADLTVGGLVSDSNSKDRPLSETNKVKSNTTKGGKKKMKDILKAADAAGSTSDLYMAYKGPEEKQENDVSSQNNDPSSINVKQTPANDAENNVIMADEDGQTKAEPDDWEDAAEISTPKLKNSVAGKQGQEDGKTSKKYTRDFLLTLSEQCTNLPAGFEIGSDIADSLMSAHVGVSHIVEREMYPSAGRGGGRSGRGSGMVDPDSWNKSPGAFNSRHGGPVGGFRPGQGGNHGVIRNIPGQYGGGIFTSPQSVPQHGGMPRSNSDAGRWNHKGIIPSPHTTPLQVMHRAERKYEIRKVSDIEEAKQRQLKAILNKLTPQNFEKLFEQVKEVNIDNAVTLTGVISQIFDKALMEPTFCEMYADFCFHLSVELPDFSEGDEKITFKRLLLNKCQEEFERGEQEQAEANRAEEEGEIKCSAEEREAKRVQARRRMLGNIRLIGELFKKTMLTERIMHECIKKLLGDQHQNPDEEDIESLCKLMSTIGEMIDHYKAKPHIDAYFEIMAQFSNNMRLSSRVRFMLKDSIDLRRNKWQQRRKVEGPKKIDEVHRAAALERHAQATRVSRGPSMGSSSRRGQPLDFGQRGSTVLSPPNSQMGGLRGFAPQVRGYNQDARTEERYSYESRAPSVPLSQRPLDDGSITLGPQGGLARGMSVRGQPLVSGVPFVDIPSAGDPRRFAAGPNGYSSSEWSPYAREEVIPRYAPERSMPVPTYDQSNSQERHTFPGDRDLRGADCSMDGPVASPVTPGQGNSSVPIAHVAPEKVWPEERLREMSISAIREFYSAKDMNEVALCMKELNSPGFYPSMVSLWVTDSFERKDMERDLLAKLLVELTKCQDNLLNSAQLIQGFESVLETLEDAVNDAPRAAEFLGRILAKVVMENVVPLKEIGRAIHDGGEEPGRLLEIGLASDVLCSILEIIKLEKGESYLKEIRTNSNLLLDDFRPPDVEKWKKLEAFF